MPFSVKYDPKLKCVMAQITGPLNPIVFKQFFMQMGTVVAEHDCKRVFSDLTKARIDASITKIYNHVKSPEHQKISVSTKRAIVVSDEIEDYKFWETVCYNQGYDQVRIF